VNVTFGNGAAIYFWALKLPASPFFSHSRPHQDHRPKGGNPGGEKICKILDGKPEQSDGNPVGGLIEN
jgi:hypothetical protein